MNRRLRVLPQSSAPHAGGLGLSRLLVVACCLLLVCQAGAKLPEGASPKEARAQLVTALNAGAYDEATPLLKQLIEWLDDSEKYAKEVEKYRFQLGLCYYLTANFAGADDAFTEYLQKYRRGDYAFQAATYLGDSMRFTKKLADAVKQYDKTLQDYPASLNDDWRTDIFSSMARCYLAEDNWKGAIPWLERVYRDAPDDLRANWAATLLTVAYLKERQLDKVYGLVPYLMDENSLAGCSVAFNLTALEAGDALFADESYREALWIYRLVHPRAWIEKQAQRQVRDYKEYIGDLREETGRYRELMRAQETLGEAEAALEALKQVPDYDVELKFRIARSYLEVRRFREARGLFLHLRGLVDEERGEEPLYLAFICSTNLRPWDRAFEIGMAYLKDYPHPKGQFYDEVSLTVGQMHASLQQWPSVISVLTAALETHPEHESAAECMFLIGYASFMEEKYADAIRWLEELNEKFPEHERVEESTYWLGMAYLFDGNYTKGFSAFEHFVNAFPDSPYVEDATFRRAVCQYGLSQFAAAEASLLAFNARFPESKLVAESFMMLADISGTVGDLRQGVERYDQAIARGDDLNIELYNHCCFRRGDMLNDLEDFATVVDHFTAYIERNREGSNIPMAVFQIAKAKWQQDDQNGAMRCLLDAVSTYGRDRRALGIDMLLQEWIGRARNLHTQTARAAWGQLRDLRQRASQEGARTLELRLRHVLLFAPRDTTTAAASQQAETEVAALRSELLQLPNVEFAPPTLLEYMIDEGPKAGQPELATAAAEAVVRDFSETDYVVAARFWLARQAMAAEDFATAEEHLNVIREAFASSPAAGDALLILGDMYLSQKKFTRADECYKDVLGVREWRGPKWPQAVFGRGECCRQQRQYLKACAYYERIYLLYGHYGSWVAKAFLARADCLQRLSKTPEAREVLETMLANTELAEFPEYEQAKSLLGQLGGR